MTQLRDDSHSTGAGVAGLSEATKGGQAPAGISQPLLAAVFVVALVYALPLLISWVRGTGPLNISDYDDRIYLARILDVYRGGSLVNPYLIEHEHGPTFMPEFGERCFAGTARLLHVAPLRVVSAGIIVLPVGIFLLCFLLGRKLGLPPPYAVLAGLMLVLMPSITRILPPYSPDQFGFLRYYGVGVSPASYVALLLAALVCIEHTWATRGRVWVLLAAGAVGLTFYTTPPYFWSFAWGGTLLLALSSGSEQRKRLLAVAALSLCLGLPTLVRLLAGARPPEVQETLERLDLMTPGHLPDTLTTFLGFSTLALAAIVWHFRKQLLPAGTFLLPFLVGGGLLFFQAVVTGRRVQEFHWAHCVVPIAYITLAGMLHLWRSRLRRSWLLALATTVVFAATLTQAAGYFRLMQAQAANPLMWAPDRAMPQTLAWINAHTPAGSVLLAKDPEEMAALVIYTQDKVYWAVFAEQHVISESEVRARMESLERWNPEHAFRLPYRADYFLGHRAECAGVPPAALLYQNPSEQTCLAAMSKLGGN